MQTELFISGNDIAPDNGEYFEVLNPATEQVFAKVARASASDVEKAVAEAKQGYQIWSSLAPKEREAALLRAADIVAEQGMQRLLDIVIDESGSAISKARNEILYTVDLLRTAAGEARRLYGDTFPNDNPERISMVMRHPLGVVAVVSPYNAPLALLTKMAAFPLAAGNAVVIKPSEETPVIAIEFAKILLEAGIPRQAVHVVTGFGAECGAPLVEHQDVNCIALTGSTGTGQHIGAVAMKRMVKAQLELGGKSAALVLADVDPVKAANIVAQGIFTHAGQICMANSRVVVHQDIYQPFIDALKHAAEQLKVGDLRDESTVYGPLINRKAVEKIQQHVDEALSQGASLLTGGYIIDGLVYAPTVLLDTASTSSAWCDESFGPLTNVVKADSLQHAIALANDSQFGLSACVLTKNISWAMQAVRGIDAGSVHVGMHSFQSNALAPIGGSKLSGVGRSGGAYSTQEFTDVKWVSIEVNETL
ncbi:aldehyde dehydrogenase family protein [Thalassotalea sp. HSM 43]|uniref:aldehyde dehydrogenase family protein n=1 Tax=Thalassotalea sp. HSM 43 TaxID=2552945 RepID=UPI001080FAA9|nr:aldehyde dehydrogenase family protein [Thalassotalea sp. HSM 43]QBY04518.1 aldehyde dehydrogenase family protein [Thalassotalea sp. HSM 43]